MSEVRDRYWSDWCCVNESRVFVATAEQIRRLSWRNVSPVVRTVEASGFVIDVHADGRCTLVKDSR